MLLLSLHPSYTFAVDYIWTILNSVKAFWKWKWTLTRRLEWVKLVLNICAGYLSFSLAFLLFLFSFFFFHFFFPYIMWPDTSYNNHLFMAGNRHLWVRKPWISYFGSVSIPGAWIHQAYLPLSSHLVNISPQSSFIDTTVYISVNIFLTNSVFYIFINHWSKPVHKLK